MTAAVRRSSASTRSSSTCATGCSASSLQALRAQRLRQAHLVDPDLAAGPGRLQSYRQILESRLHREPGKPLVTELAFRQGRVTIRVAAERNLRVVHVQALQP